MCVQIKSSVNVNTYNTYKYTGDDCNGAVQGGRDAYTGRVCALHDAMKR